jgi:hypothetical protein
MAHRPSSLARARRRLLRLAAGLSLGLGLAAAPAAGAADKGVARATPAKTAPPAAMSAVRPPAKAAAKAKARPKKVEPPHLPFVEGDYERALADARARNVPLVVDVWAPW